MQHPQLNEMVVWNEKLMAALPHTIQNFGPGPFRVLGLRLHQRGIKTPCPYTITVELANGKRHDFDGEWFKAAKPSYRPATSLEPIVVERTDCPLVVLRSHPNFPNTLSAQLEGAWTGMNPSWPELSVERLLSLLDPQCHTILRDSSNDPTEERDGLKAYVVYVRPGPAPQV